MNIKIIVGVRVRCDGLLGCANIFGHQHIQTVPDASAMVD